ncbi:MAG: flagellar hook-length control protein FliK [Brevundimonas sp.]|nr:flagellar hook-length control protein FliK [Brevundimonas sp.]
MSRAAVEATAQIAAQILRRLDSRTTRFEMALLPEELGRVDVKLDIDSEGRLAARLAFDNPAAAADLRGRTDELRRQLEQAGFHLADDAFEFADRDSGSSAFDRGEDPRRGSGRAFTAAARLNAEADAPVARWTSLSLAPAGVDLKV